MRSCGARDKLTKGLVLSGGGFFGAFQAGVYPVLSDFDVVIGASAGSLNAWAIASGMPPEELQSLWCKAAGMARGGPRLPRYWGDGILDAKGFETMVRDMVARWKPRKPIGVVVSQGRAFTPVLVQNGSVDADVLLASCAVPFLLPAKRIRGVLSFDGGVIDACPIWAAREMGAQQTLAINVWTHLPAWWPRRRRGSAPGHSASLRIIEPPSSLGPLRSSALATPAQVARWIDLGRQTAEAFFERQ